MAGYKPEDIATLLSLFKQEKLKAVIDKLFELQEIVEAHRYVEAGRKAGNVVINIYSSETA